MTKCIFFNENRVNHKICQIAIRRPGISVKDQEIEAIDGLHKGMMEKAAEVDCARLEVRTDANPATHVVTLAGNTSLLLTGSGRTGSSQSTASCDDRACQAVHQVHVFI